MNGAKVPDAQVYQRQLSPSTGSSGQHALHARQCLEARCGRAVEHVVEGSLRQRRIQPCVYPPLNRSYSADRNVDMCSRRFYSPIVFTNGTTFGNMVARQCQPQGWERMETEQTSNNTRSKIEVNASMGLRDHSAQRGSLIMQSQNPQT